MAFKQPAYPQELTDAWWQKHKGAIAKIATRDDGTGIGKKLTALQVAYRKIDWDGLDYDVKWPGNFGQRTEDDIKAGIASSREVAKRSDVVSKQARDVEIAAKNLAAAWAKERLIPKSSTAAAQKISDAAKQLSFALALGTIAEIAKKGAEENREGTRKNKAVVRKALADVPGKLDLLAVDAAKGVTIAEWPQFWSQNVRFIGTQAAKVLSLYPDAEDEIKDLRVHSNKQRTPKDQNELNGWLKELSTGAKALRVKMV